MTQGYAVFDTALGHAGVAWDERAVVGCRLPDMRADRVRNRLRAAFPEAVESDPPDHVRHAIRGITALLRGEPADLSDVMLGLDGVPEFQRRVYEVVRTIPPGSTATYGEIAARIGEPGAARAVGQALGRNPFAPIVPCHRVLAAGGKPGGFSAPGGAATKRRMLEIEGVYLGEPTLFDL